MRAFTILTALITLTAYSFSGTVLAPLSPQQAQAASSLEPVMLSIPSIGLNNKVVPMGIDKLGNLDVPAGDTNHVGWYAKGPLPGERGAAVMDAHVYAAFERLNEVGVGDKITVIMDDGSRKHFKVKKTKVYKLEDLSSKELFTRTDGRYLHLITCAGGLTPDRSTYTHRLVVYAELVT